MPTGQVLGYARVSSADQHADRQRDSITDFSAREYGRLDKLYVDDAFGKSMKRPQFLEMDRFARAGDTIVLHSILTLRGGFPQRRLVGPVIGF